MKLLVPPVILRPSLKRLEQYESSIAQPMSREVTFFQQFRGISLVLEQFAVYHVHLLYGFTQ